MRSKHNTQYCILWIEQDILDTWGVCKISGKIGSSGKKTWYPCTDQLVASKLLVDIECSIRSRGYVYDDLKYNEYFSLRPQTINEVLNSEPKNNE